MQEKYGSLWQGANRRPAEDNLESSWDAGSVRQFVFPIFLYILADAT